MKFSTPVFLISTNNQAVSPKKSFKPKTQKSMFKSNEKLKILM